MPSLIAAAAPCEQRDSKRQCAPSAGSRRVRSSVVRRVHETRFLVFAFGNFSQPPHKMSTHASIFVVTLNWCWGHCEIAHPSSVPIPSARTEFNGSAGLSPWAPKRFKSLNWLSLAVVGGASPLTASSISFSAVSSQTQKTHVCMLSRAVHTTSFFSSASFRYP